jgi:hypothetical protein
LTERHTELQSQPPSVGAVRGVVLKRLGGSQNLQAVGRALAVFVSLAVVCSPWAAEINGPLPPLLFPQDNWWNTEITWAPVDWNSDAYIAFINEPGTQRLHPGVGREFWPGSDEIWGFPHITVNWWQPKQVVNFMYWQESDGVGTPFYPIPDEAIWQPHWFQGGWPGRIDRRDSDRRMFIVDIDNNYLYELWNVFFDESSWQWYAGSGAFFDMNTNNRRPEGWTSANAAGMATLPGVLRYDEAYGPDEIRHAFGVTVRTTNGYVYPASHWAGSTPGALPMGARLRLKSWVDISYFPAECQRIFRAMKTYGLIVLDNGGDGGDMNVFGSFDPRWDNDIINPCFHSLNAWHFEIVELGWRP